MQNSQYSAPFVPFQSTQQPDEDTLYMVNMLKYIKENSKNDVVANFVSSFNSHLSDLEKTPKDKELDQKMEFLTKENADMKQKLDEILQQLKNNNNNKRG